MDIQCGIWNLHRTIHILHELYDIQRTNLFGGPFKHTFSAFWLWSSVVSVLISVTTDILPTGSFYCHINFFRGNGHCMACQQSNRMLPLPCTSAECGIPFWETYIYNSCILVRPKLRKEARIQENWYEIPVAGADLATGVFFSRLSYTTLVITTIEFCLILATTRNLPGWRWATITKVALDRLSRSLHSDVCDSDGCRDAVVHSTISGRRGRRLCAAPNILYKNWTFTFVPSPFHKYRFPTLYIAFTRSEPVETTAFVDCTRTGSLL